MKNAFTLAEVLTTLLIVGIISAITLPILQSGVDEKLLMSQKQTFNAKLKEGFRYMQIKGALAEHYNSTEEFVNKMKNYTNITKSCDKNNLDKCFSSKIYDTRKHVKYNAKQIHTSGDIQADFTNSDLHGIVFSDGTSAIIAHDPDCIVTNKFDPLAKTTACIVMIYDVNGNDAPNLIGEDIDTINLLTNEYGREIAIGEVFQPTSYTVEQCTRAINDGAPIKECYLEDDYWAMAVDKCFKEGKKLPSIAQLKEIAMTIYGVNVNLTGTTSDLPDAQGSTWNKLSGNNPDARVTYWSNEESNKSISWARTFRKNLTECYGGTNINLSRDHSSYKAFCIE